MSKVTVVTVTHNRAALLKKAVASVLAQTFQDWELLIIDDGSRDHTKALVGNFSSIDNRIRYFFQNHKGVSAGRARGVDLACGEYITFLDDDDEFLPNKLQEQVAFLEAHSKVGLVYSYVEMIGNQAHRKWPYRAAESFIDLIKDCLIQPNSVLIRSACFKKLGNFRTDFTGGDDYEMWLRIAKHYCVAFLPITVGIYRWHENNMSYDYKRRCRNNVNVFKAADAYDLSADERKDVIKRVIELTYTKGSDSYSSGDYSNALFYFVQALRFSPTIGLHIVWGRLQNPIYGLLRPYLAILISAFFILRSILIKGRFQNA